MNRRALLISKGWVQAVLLVVLLSLVLVGLSLLILIAAGARNHEPREVALLGVLLVAALLVGRTLGNDFRAHPSNFPAATAAKGGTTRR